MSYARTALAAEICQKLLRPGALDASYRSGLFLSAPRRTGKSTFLMNDLIPALEAQGAVVIYVDLWSNPTEDPGKLVHAALVQALEQLQSPGSSIIETLKRVKGLELGAGGLKFGFKLEDIGVPKGVTLAQALQAVVDQAQTDVVMIIDEVQHAISEAGLNMLTAMKAARDQINLPKDTPGRFLFVGTGSHRSFVNEMTTRRNQPFEGAMRENFPVLDDGFVRYQLEAVRNEMGPTMPSEAAALRAFRLLGSRPEEFLKALTYLRRVPEARENADQALDTVSMVLRASVADREIDRLATLGPLAEAVFGRLVRAGVEVQLFSGAAAAEYSEKVGRKVAVDEIQPVVNLLVAENILMRRGHGRYGVSDEFVGQAWQERHPAAPLVIEVADDPEPPALPAP